VNYLQLISSNSTKYHLYYLMDFWGSKNHQTLAVFECKLKIQHIFYRGHSSQNLITVHSTQKYTSAMQPLENKSHKLERCHYTVTEVTMTDKTDDIAFTAYKDKSVGTLIKKPTKANIAISTKTQQYEVTERIPILTTTLSRQQSSQYCTSSLATRFTTVCCWVHFPAARCRSCSAVLVVAH